MNSADLQISDDILLIVNFEKKENDKKQTTRSKKKHSMRRVFRLIYAVNLGFTFPKLYGRVIQFYVQLRPLKNRHNKGLKDIW